MWNTLSDHFINSIEESLCDLMDDLAVFEVFEISLNLKFEKLLEKSLYYFHANMFLEKVPFDSKDNSIAFFNSSPSASVF